MEEDLPQPFNHPSQAVLSLWVEQEGPVWSSFNIQHNHRRRLRYSLLIFTDMNNRMDAALLTQRLRHQAIALAPKVKATDKSNATTLGAQIAGSGTFWVNGLAQGGCDCTPPSSTPQPDPTPLQTFVFATQDQVFQYIVSTNCGPTRASRFLYLWMNTVVGAYNWVQTTGPLSSIVDGWNWAVHFPLSNIGFTAAWMTQCLAFAMPLLFPGTSTAQQLYQLERNLRLWTPLEQSVQAGYVKDNGQFALWQAAWTTWFAARQLDGFVAAQVPPTFAQLPNGGLLLDPATTQDISGTYPNPFQWTPLVINSIPKPYYTRTWENVRSVVLTTANDTAAKTAAAPFFPGPNTPPPIPPTTNTSQRQAELAEVVRITGLLGLPPTPGSPNDSDYRKVEAEFWAGGPRTITPPGMFMWLWRQHALAFNISQQIAYGYNSLFYTGLDLAINLFEMGRVAWGLKLQYVQARPIQDIRRNYATTDISGWRTTVDASGVIQPAADISGNLWLPYQETNFVTPPFPDFVSGHSAYSQVFALVMSRRYGATIPESPPTNATDLPIFSPIFSGAQAQPFGVFQVSPGASKIQPAIVPWEPLTLRFTTWAGIAESAGVSRQWGGIHAVSAYTGGRVAADSVNAAIRGALGGLSSS